MVKRVWGRQRIHGQQFESIVVKHAHMQGIHVIKMPLGAERRGRILVQVKTPFDYILVSNGIVVFLDCKSIDSDKFPFSLITDHQRIALSEAQRNGCQSGYLVWFREINEVAFFNAEKLINCQPGCSLKPTDGLLVGKMEDIALGTLFV